MAVDETELIRRCLQGDQSAHELLYAAHAGRVMAYLLRSGFAQADAEDVCQETFARACGALRTFDANRGTLGVWLSAIARNVARKQWARRKEPDNFDPELAEETFAAAENPSHMAEAREEVEAVSECVNALPAELAEIVRLRYVAGRTTRGVAAAINIPEATVRLRLEQARELLEKCLRERGFV